MFEGGHNLTRFRVCVRWLPIIVDLGPFGTFHLSFRPASRGRITDLRRGRSARRYFQVSLRWSQETQGLEWMAMERRHGTGFNAVAKEELWDRGGVENR
jgi:hypothetical protein